MTRPVLLLAALVAGALSLAPTARAGQYTVNACGVGERFYPNQLLAVAGTASGTHTDTSCDTQDTSVNVNLLAGSTMPDASSIGLRFTAPAGTTIAGFTTKARFLVDVSDDVGHNPYVMGLLGGTAFAGSGHYSAGTQNALTKAGTWYSDGASTPYKGDSKNVTLSSGTLKALAGYAGDATTLEFRLGCIKLGSVCNTTAASAGALIRVFSLQLTLNDATPPALTVAANGLLGGGSPAGSTPVTVSASDAAGIKAVVLLDVTNPAQPQIVGGETYDPADPNAVKAGGKSTCTYQSAHACPDLSGEDVVPTALSSGVRQLVVRAIDTAGNVTDAGPYRVDAATPSNRGALNGVDATEEGSKLTADFTTGKGGSRTVDSGQRPTIRGRLTNASGAPVAGAKLTVYTRDTDKGSYSKRGTLTTGDEGRYAFKAKSPNSRYVRVVWVSHEFDTRTAATDAVKLRVRGRAKLSAPRTVSLGKRFSIGGTLRGTRPTSGVRVVAEVYEAGHYRLFQLGKTSKGGRFKLANRFQNAANRGKVFRMRVRILARAGWPYTDGTTKRISVRVR